VHACNRCAGQCANEVSTLLWNSQVFACFLPRNGAFWEPKFLRKHGPFRRNGLSLLNQDYQFLRNGPCFLRNPRDLRAQLLRDKTPRSCAWSISENVSKTQAISEICTDLSRIDPCSDLRYGLGFWDILRDLRAQLLGVLSPRSCARRSLRKLRKPRLFRRSDQLCTALPGCTDPRNGLGFLKISQDLKSRGDWSNTRDLAAKCRILAAPGQTFSADQPTRPTPGGLYSARFGQGQRFCAKI